MNRFENKAENRIQELIEDGQDYIDSGMSIKLTFEILKKSTTLSKKNLTMVERNLIDYSELNN